MFTIPTANATARASKSSVGKIIFVKSNPIFGVVNIARFFFD
jgi:hypothetical protein